MIDRDNKKVINGFGSIGVATRVNANELRLTYIKPPQEIGLDILNAEIEVCDTLNFRLTFSEWRKLSADLEKVTYDNNKVYFRDWEFNFEEFNQKSVNVYIRACKRMFSLALAC